MKNRMYFLSLFLVFSIFADLEQDLSLLSVELSSLQKLLAIQLANNYVDAFKEEFVNATYTLSNGKQIKVMVGDLTKLNTFDRNIPPGGAFTDMQADAIVNAANETCLGGGGIDGAIHKAIDNVLGKGVFLEVCTNLPEKYGKDKRCKTGGAELVPGLTLAKFIVQAVGPDMRKKGMQSSGKKLLTGAYENSLKVVDKPQDQLASRFDLKKDKKAPSNREIYKKYGIAITSDLSVKTIAFPSISTGIFAYPIDEAAGIATSTVLEYLENNPKSNLEKVLFVFFEQGNKEKTKTDYNRYIRLLNQKLGIEQDKGLQK